MVAVPASSARGRPLVEGERARYRETEGGCKLAIYFCKRRKREAESEGEQEEEKEEERHILFLFPSYEVGGNIMWSIVLGLRCARQSIGNLS